MHAAGFLHTDVTPDARGGYGYYRSSTQASATNGYVLDFHNWEFGSVCDVVSTVKAYGATVRCIK